jgi:hypothetical protein
VAAREKAAGDVTVSESRRFLTSEKWAATRAAGCGFVKVAQNAAQSIICQKSCTRLVPWKKVAQLFVLLLPFSQKLPKENSHPMGKNSPNLVTLDATFDGGAAFRCRHPNFRPSKCRHKKRTKTTYENVT